MLLVVVITLIVHVGHFSLNAYSDRAREEGRKEEILFPVDSYNSLLSPMTGNGGGASMDTFPPAAGRWLIALAVFSEKIIF
jgi:hypothetical protein